MIKFLILVGLCVLGWIGFAFVLTILSNKIN